MKTTGIHGKKHKWQVNFLSILIDIIQSLERKNCFLFKLITYSKVPLTEKNQNSNDSKFTSESLFIKWIYFFLQACMNLTHEDKQIKQLYMFSIFEIHPFSCIW